MNQERISIIVPVYNSEKYLVRCVDSLLKQTYPNLEIILVNDGSNDGSLKICKEYEEKNSNVVVINKNNGGLSSARNVGLMSARGLYIGFVDSDDWISMDMYQYMYELAIREQADVVDIACVQTDGKISDIKQPKEKIEIFEGDDILVQYLYRGMNEQKGAPFSVWRKLYRRKLFPQNEKTFKEGVVNEDICFNYVILEKARRVAISNQIKYFYFQNIESLTAGKLKKRDLDLLAVSKELVHLAMKIDNPYALELAKMKQARSDFSILSKIAVGGIDESVEDSDNLIKNLRERLKNNLYLLWKSPMPVNRKILCTAFAINYRLCCNVISIIHLF